MTLLEEPPPPSYSWIANNLAQSRKLLYDGQIVLVCDVGGGTSVFSLIRVERQGDLVNFTRTAVGKHLLLGGDNSGPHHRLAGRDQLLGVPLSITPAQRPAPPVHQRQRAPAERSQPEER